MAAAMAAVAVESLSEVKSAQCNEVMSTQVCETVNNVRRHNRGEKKKHCVCLKIVHAFSRVHFSFDVPL